MKFVALIMCVLSACMTLFCAAEGYIFAAGFNLFASILNAVIFIECLSRLK